MIDLEQRLGTHISRFLTNGCAKLSCPPGTVGKDLDLPDATREPLREWIRSVRDGAVIGGSGRGLLVTGGTGPARNHVAGALATNAVLAGIAGFAATPVSAIPFRTLSATAYIEAVRATHDDNETESADLVRSMKAGFTGYFGRVLNVQLAVLLDLGTEPRTTSSTFAEDQLRALLSLRIERGFPTIVTTKFSSSVISRIYGQDMLELFDAYFVPVKLGKAVAAR